MAADVDASRPPEPSRSPGDPPRFMERLLAGILPPGPVGESILGDLREEHGRLNARGRSARAAAWWYRRQALGIAWRAAGDRLRGRGPLGPRPALGRPTRGGGDGMIRRTLGSLRYGLRALARAPQFALAAVLTLALAIGANAAIFSVVQGVLLKPLPYGDPERLVTLRHSAPGLGYERIPTSPGIYFLYRDQRDLFEATGISQEADVNLTGDDAPPQRLAAARTSRGVFVTLGVAPALGRFFDEAEDSPGGPAAVLLSQGLWRERFGADPGVLGRAVHIDGVAHTVVGVMPPGFEFPNRDARLWLPLGLDETERRYGAFSYSAVARLRGGLAAAEAEDRLRPVLDRLREEEDAGDFRAFMDAGRLVPVVTPLKEQVVGDVRRALWVLLGTVGFVFLIACANLANLFLVRAEARQKEMAVRSALGAGRRGLLGHYLAESGLVSAAGGILGLALAWTGVRALLGAAPPGIPRLHEISVDPGVLTFTAAVTALATLLLGLVPTLRLTSSDLLAALGRSGRGSGTSRERHRARQVLVVAQTALALVLLVGSGLMVRSFQKLRALDPGFQPRHGLTFRLSLPAATYPDGERVALFHAQLLERLRGVPGAESVGAISHMPLAGCCSGTAHDLEDRPTEPGELPPIFWYSTASDGYFEAMRIPLVAGRTFDATDRDPENRSVIVSQALARRFWPDGDALHRHIRPSSDTTAWYTVAGVVGDVRDRALELEVSEMVYYPVAPGVGGPGDRHMTYVVRTPRPDASAPMVRQAVWDLDPNLPVASTSTLERIVAESMVRLSFTMLALLVASGIALFLGALGLYGVISYVVAQRTNEIGIRLALGARPDQVRSMVVLQGARLSALGLLLGLAAALALTRFMQGMLFGTEPTDPATLAVVSAFLAGVTLLASYFPARRASRIDPASSVKAE